MDKKIAGLLGATAALTTMTPPPPPSPPSPPWFRHLYSLEVADATQLPLLAD